MTDYESIAGLSVATVLRKFIETELLPAAGIAPGEFWLGFAAIVDDIGPRGRELLATRDRFQAEIDRWHVANPGAYTDLPRYRAFLAEIGYLLPVVDDVIVSTEDVDDEIALRSGPQLVVPVTNARYALNAANARWGSLYDAFYGTDALPGAAQKRGYDEVRGGLVVDRVRSFLDESFPLHGGTHAEARGYRIAGAALVVEQEHGAAILADPAAFVGYQGDPTSPVAIVLRRHGNHVVIRIDRSGRVGETDPAGVSDVEMEGALTAIIDFEDSVATVDPDDKVHAYRQWLGINRGDLSATFDKGGRTVTRTLEMDRTYTAPGGAELILPGRAVLFVRNVGHLMTTDAVLDSAGEEIGEGILDAVVTALCAVPGRDPRNPFRNGRTGSIYIVKPKMHGPAEAALTRDLFARVEALIGLPARTIKVGVMDEERRTTLNLRSTIAEVADRVVFINTGFLDRSGDEIHTSMEAGPIVPKAQMKSQKWILAYENQNVDVGVEMGLVGHGQIGKGMWAMPDLMADMLQEKISHPTAGATTAWVPSPTAATLHALHYQMVDVAARHQAIRGREAVRIDDLLTVPVGDPSEWDESLRRREVDNNVQGLLGYVVRWVDLGVGASKVPDINDIGLMEDRATLRISSQLLANWLRHGVVSEDQVRDSMRRMAAIVDAQNAGEPGYRRMTDDLEASIAFAAAQDLVFLGSEQPNGYTEPILHRRRRQVKDTQRESLADVAHA